MGGSGSDRKVGKGGSQRAPGWHQREVGSGQMGGGGGGVPVWF